VPVSLAAVSRPDWSTTETRTGGAPAASSRVSSTTMVFAGAGWLGVASPTEGAGGAADGLGVMVASDGNAGPDRSRARSAIRIPAAAERITTIAKIAR